jgi:protein CpxP
MTNQDSAASTPNETPPRDRRRRGRGALLIVLALVAGLVAGGVLSTAFAHGFMGEPWHHAGFMGGPSSPAQIDGRIDRMTKHMAIELDATPEQQAKVASIAKSAVHDLLPLREKAQAARGRAVTLLTAPTVDRDAIERLRAEQVGLAETASKRIAQALADASDALTSDQRRKIGDWVESFGPWARWHRD